MLDVLIFNVTTDDVELAPGALLGNSSEDVDVYVGDFFDTVDRQFLRERKSVRVFQNNGSELIPDVFVDVTTDTLNSPEYLEDNGDPSEEFDSDDFITLTPIRPRSPTDVFVMASPAASARLGSDQSESDQDFEYLASVCNRPRRVQCSDESSLEILRPDLPVRWVDRLLKCFKYVDDCLSIEKVFFKDAVRIKLMVKKQH